MITKSKVLTRSEYIKTYLTTAQKDLESLIVLGK
jgi:hypothetical protein